jgi:hypothetical protein
MPENHKSQNHARKIADEIALAMKLQHQTARHHRLALYLAVMPQWNAFMQIKSQTKIERARKLPTELSHYRVKNLFT